jgi:mono/diheme cytochrome c family protein
MRSVIVTLLTVVILAVGGAFTFICAGVYDVAATRPHWPITYWAMETVRVQSVRARASGITPPSWISDESRVIDGAAHFAAHCASCHGAPGVPRGDLADRLYPRPADLKDSVQRYTPGELFWIVKNGIKMSGMPAWSDHSGEELWGTVAFLERLPGMSEAGYAKLVMETISRGGRHSHGGGDGAGSGAAPMMDHSSMPGMPPMPGMTPAAPDDHKH